MGNIASKSNNFNCERGEYDTRLDVHVFEVAHAVFEAHSAVEFASTFTISYDDAMIDALWDRMMTIETIAAN